MGSPGLGGFKVRAVKVFAVFHHFHSPGGSYEVSGELGLTKSERLPGWRETGTMGLTV